MTCKFKLKLTIISQHHCSEKESQLQNYFLAELCLNLESDIYLYIFQMKTEFSDAEQSENHEKAG